MGTARASEMPVLIVNGDDSPRSRIGRGLESIGGMTAETLQRISTAVGGVVKSPVVLISKVGGLASPRVATLTAPPQKSLAERVYHLENQMKSLEENFSPMTVMTTLDVSTSSDKEKPRIAKSLLQEMEPDRTLEKRVQILEDLVNERMERFEKILSNIQSRLDHVELSWRESVAGEERQESVSGEPEYYDAEQQSDNLEILEASEENFFGGSPPLEKSQTSSAEHVEPLHEIDDENNDAFLEPKVVSTPVYSKESFLVQPSSEPVESVRRDDAVNLPASLDRQLDSTLEELHGSFVTESSAAAASAKFSETARPITAEKGILGEGEHDQDVNGQQPAQEHEQHLEQGSEQEHGQETGQEHGLATAQAPGQEHEQEPAQEHEQEPAQEHEQEPAPERGQQPAQESGQDPAQELGHDPAQELGHKPEQQSEQQPSQEPEQEDLTRNSAMALPPSEPQVTSKSPESQELLAEESLAAAPSTKFEEPPQGNAADESGTRDLTLTPTAEEPRVDTVVSPEKSLSPSLSSTSFHQSGNPELLENLEQKYSDAPDSSSTPQEALEREPLTAAPPNTEIAQGQDAGKSDNVHTSSEPQLEEFKEALANEPVQAVHTPSEPQLEESKEALANGPVQAVPSSESIEPDQEVGDGQSGVTLASSEPQLRPALEETQEGLVKKPLPDAESASKSADLEEALADEPSAVTTSAKLAPESDVDKINAGIVEESPLTPIAEELQNGSVDSLAEGKHGQDEADRKLSEDVKISAQPIEEAIPRTQSDLTHVKLNPEAAEDATELQSQGSFLAFGGATSVDSKEALLKEPLPSSSKLLELFEEENNSGKRGPVPADSPMTSTAEEPQKPLADAKPEPEPEPALASAKSVPKGHARWRGFARSSSEPQFAYKLEEHRKALAKESSVAAAAPPSASKLGEDHAEEEFGDTQCLPFRILGEGKPPRKESEFKLREDVKSPAMKSETAESSPYVLEPKPSKIKEKKKKEKKEKKERKPVAAAEEKERRLSLGVGELERKSSLTGEEKGSKDSPRAEEKHKQPFWHFRGRLRHAFSVNKEL